MKDYIHARLTQTDRIALDELKRSTGYSESEILRRGLGLMLQEIRPKTSALQLAGKSVGKFSDGARDLSTNKKHMEGFGE